MVELKLLQTEFLQLKTTMTEDYCKKKTATESDFTEDPECFKIINAVLSDTNKRFDPASSEHFSINW